MDLYDWLLLLHVLAAFVLVAGVVVVGAVLRSGGPSVVLLPLGQRLWDVGGIAVLVFGIWLALDADAYELWDAWILAALVVYAIAASTGARALREYREAAAAGAPVPSRVMPLYAIMAAGTAAILVLMIFKPGA